MVSLNTEMVLILGVVFQWGLITSFAWRNPLSQAVSSLGAGGGGGGSGVGDLWKYAWQQFQISVEGKKKQQENIARYNDTLI